MKKIIATAFILIVFILIVGQGCIKETPPKPTTEEGTAGTTVQETGTGTAQENINDLEQGISDIDQIDSELNVSDLDNLGNELDEINW